MLLFNEIEKESILCLTLPMNVVFREIGENTKIIRIEKAPTKLTMAKAHSKEGLLGHKVSFKNNWIGTFCP